MATKYFSLDCEGESSAWLWGLSSNEKAVKFVWHLNRTGNWNFFRCDDFEVRRKGKFLGFIHFEHKNSDDDLTYHLIKNQCDGALLIPELKQIQYFIYVKYLEDTPAKPVQQLLNKPESGMLCFRIQENMIKTATRDLFFV